MQPKRPRKLYCYVDESGQDTKGHLFIVVVILTIQPTELVEKLEAAETVIGTPKTSSSKSEHALQGDSSPLGCFFIDNYLVDDLAFDQSLKHPGEVGWMDAVHGGARADNRVEAEDELLWMFLCQAMYEVNFGSYGPLASRRSTLDLLYDVLGRAVEIGCLDHLAAT